jgi:Methyltransferase small domain
VRSSLYGEADPGGYSCPFSLEPEVRVDCMNSPQATPAPMAPTPLTTAPAMTPTPPMLRWLSDGVPCLARWRSERGASPPRNVVLADDTLTADQAYRLACEGTALLWQGDFQNARQLLQALVRRVDRVPERKQRRAPEPVRTPLEQFHAHRQAQSQRARVLAMVLIPLGADYQVPLRRAPDMRAACAAVWGAPDAQAGVSGAVQADPAAAVHSVTSLRELMGLISAYEWRRAGVEVPALGPAPHNRIHPHYGVFSPVRGEYVDLVAQAPLPAACAQGGVAFDIGVGTGVLSAVLVRRGVRRVVATDQDPRALACAADNLARLGVSAQVELLQADLFPAGQADVVVCNPPWLPARPGSPIEHAVYDENSRMLLGFLTGLASHLTPGGEGWLILSDLAEHLGLRSRDTLLGAFAQAGLVVAGRLDARPRHPKATDARDPLHQARAAELTSLWRLKPFVA